MITNQPLIIGEILSYLGAGKSVALAITALVGLYHFRSILELFSVLGFVSKILSVVALIGVFAVLGFIPGVTLDIAIGRLIGAGEWAVGLGRSLLEVVV